MPRVRLETNTRKDKALKERKLTAWEQLERYTSLLPLLLDTNCLLISVACIMEGRQHRISDSPKRRCKCQHGSFNNGIFYLQQRLTLQAQNQTCVSVRATYYWGNVLTIMYRRYPISWHSWPALQNFPYCHVGGNPKWSQSMGLSSVHRSTTWIMPADHCSQRAPAALLFGELVSLPLHSHLFSEICILKVLLVSI